jgi:hypothetical protein
MLFIEYLLTKIQCFHEGNLYIFNQKSDAGGFETLMPILNLLKEYIVKLTNSYGLQEKITNLILPCLNICRLIHYDSRGLQSVCCG